MRRTKTLLVLSMLLAGHSYAANAPLTGINERTNNDFSIFGNSNNGYSLSFGNSWNGSGDNLFNQSFSGLLTGIVIDFQPGQVQFSFNGFQITFTNGPNGPNIKITMPDAPAPVPLPATAWLLGPGLAGLACISRRTRRNATGSEACPA